MGPRSRTGWVVVAVLVLAACARSVGGDVSAGGTTEPPSTSTTTSASTTTTEASVPASRLLYMGRSSRDSDDLLDVWSAALDGTDRRIVASGLPVKVDFYNRASLSPDGTQLAYVHKDDERVHVRHLDSGADVVVSSHPSNRASWLDDSTLVYANRDDSTTWIVGSDGRGDRFLYTGEQWGATYDGRAMVHSEPDELFVVTRDGEATEVALERSRVLGGALAPDGEHVAWTEASDCSCPEVAVLVGRPDGSEARVLPASAGEDSYFGHVAPSWADSSTVFAIRPEVAIDRTTLDGDAVDVITFGGGYWDFLGAR